ncbi:MAG: hypothetical protein J6V90_05045 [Treponema sp.]|nr:hypothetical protein [Treponema sp.]
MAANLFCQENGQVQDPKSAEQDFSALSIVQFDISGLKRTKRSYMDGILNQFLQKPASEQTLKGIETVLQAQNLFDEIKVSARPLDGTSAAVDISFKEKWTILPMPIGYYTGDTYGAGLFIMDMNAFGRHCMAAIGGMYSSNGFFAAGVFQKPPTQKGDLGFSVAGNFSKGKRDFANSKNYWVFGYKSVYAGATAKVLFKPTNSTSLSVGGGYSFFNPIDSPNVQRRNQWSVDASWGVSSSSWNGFFLSVNSFSVGGEFLFSDVAEQTFAQTLSFSGEVQQPIFDRVRLITGARGFVSNNLLRTNFVGRGKSGVTLLPSAFMTDQIFGFLTGFEAAIIKANFGILSVYGLYEVALARELNNSIYLCTGPEAGVRLYLAKLAFPAFAMGASYNVNENRFQYSFSGGASF